jgi:hypothetical protein
LIKSDGVRDRGIPASAYVVGASIVTTTATTTLAAAKYATGFHRADGRCPSGEQQRKKDRDHRDPGHVRPEPEPGHCLSKREAARRDHERLDRLLAREGGEPEAERSGAEHPADHVRTMRGDDERADDGVR